MDERRGETNFDRCVDTLIREEEYIERVREEQAALEQKRQEQEKALAEQQQQQMRGNMWVESRSI